MNCNYHLFSPLRQSPTECLRVDDLCIWSCAKDSVRDFYFYTIVLRRVRGWSGNQMSLSGVQYIICCLVELLSFCKCLGRGHVLLFCCFGHGNKAGRSNHGQNQKYRVHYRSHGFLFHSALYHISDLLSRWWPWLESRDSKTWSRLRPNWWWFVECEVCQFSRRHLHQFRWWFEFLPFAD